MTTTKFPSKSAYNLMLRNRSPKNLSYESWRENGLELEMNFLSLVETKMKMTLKYSLIDTIGAFGGLCGVMMGASLMSSFELAFFFWDILHVICDFKIWASSKVSAG